MLSRDWTGRAGSCFDWFFDNRAGRARRPPATGRGGFTLVELLVVIGIIAVLISILLPTLSLAQEQARQLKCASNLRNVGQGIAIYVAGNKGCFPHAYIYIGQKIVNGTQTPASAVNGYDHWSSYLYGTNPSGDAVALDSFLCPSIENGGIPPTNPPPGVGDAMQVPETSGVVDRQAPRLAYTLNEAVCPRNKWVKDFQGNKRVYRYVRAGQIKNSSNVILGTEFPLNSAIVSDVSRADGSSTVVKSHRPIHGFVGGDGNMDQLAPDPFGGRITARGAERSDLLGDPQPGNDFSCRLNWVGRNHGKKKLEAGFDVRKSNFLYVDGHVETKSIRDTVKPSLFEWGERFYSLEPNNDIVP